MTVRELIVKLLDMPLDMDVTYPVDSLTMEGESCPADVVKVHVEEITGARRTSQSRYRVCAEDSGLDPGAMSFRDVVTIE